MTNGFGGGYKTTDDLMTLGGPGATTQYPGVSKVLNSLGNAQFTTNISQQEEVSKLLGAISKIKQRNRNIDKSAITGENNLLLLPSIKTVRKQQQSPFKGNTMNGFFDMPNMMST